MTAVCPGGRAGTEPPGAQRVVRGGVSCAAVSPVGGWRPFVPTVRALEATERAKESRSVEHPALGGLDWLWGNPRGAPAHAAAWTGMVYSGLISGRLSNGSHPLYNVLVTACGNYAANTKAASMAGF